MSDSLRLYHSILEKMKTFHPTERITRLRNLALLVMGLYQGESVHLAKIAGHWPVGARLLSRVHRLRRFLDNQRTGDLAFFRPVAQQILSRFCGSDHPVRFLLDTTKVGPSCQIATVSVAYRKRALPLCWKAVEKIKGHLDTDQIKDLLRQAAAHVEAAQEDSSTEMPPIWVLGDSEFGQVDVIEWVRERDWHYAFRVYGHYTACSVEGKEPTRGKEPTAGTFRQIGDWSLSEGQTRPVGPVLLTEDRRYQGGHLILHWEEGYEDPWYLVSDQPVGHRTLRLYEKRMWIEELHGDLKGHGVDLEPVACEIPRV